MKTQTNPSLLKERLESIKHDVALILADVRNSEIAPVLSEDRIKELHSALHGMDFVLADLTSLRDALEKSLITYERQANSKTL